MLAVRVSPEEMKWFKERAKEGRTTPTKLQRDRLFFDMPGYSPEALVDLVEHVIETGRLEYRDGLYRVLGEPKFEVDE
jgi:hypothetical protein